MNHPEDLLPDYVLGLLPPEEAAELEAHLEDCATCQATLVTLNDSVVRLVETLLPVSPPPRVWEGLQAQLAAGEDNRAQPAAVAEPAAPVQDKSSQLPRPNYPWALATVLALMITGASLLWGYQSHQAYQQASSEQRVVSGWLSHPETQSVALQDQEGNRLGSILIRPDGRALFVLRAPAAQERAYQAWGHIKGEDDLVPLAASQRPVFEVLWSGYEALYLSLEPIEGSPQPTVPLGRLRL